MNDTYQNDLLRASVLIQAGRPQAARPILSRLVQQNTDDEQAWFLLGMALEAREQKIYAYRQVLRINPENHDARRMLDELTSASAETAGPPGSRLRRLASAEESPADLTTLLNDPDLEVESEVPGAAVYSTPEPETETGDDFPEDFWSGPAAVFPADDAASVPPFVPESAPEWAPAGENEGFVEVFETAEPQPEETQAAEPLFAAYWDEAETAPSTEEPAPEEAVAPVQAGPVPAEPVSAEPPSQPPAPAKSGPGRRWACLGCFAAGLLLLIVLVAGAVFILNAELPLLFPDGQIPAPFDQFFGSLPVELVSGAAQT